MFIVNAQTKDDSVLAHLASTIEKAVEWILKHGEDWYEEDYCFLAYEVTVDKEDFIDSKSDNGFYIDLNGNLSKDNPLLVWDLIEPDPSFDVEKQTIDRRTYTISVFDNIKIKQVLKSMESEGYELVRDYETWNKPAPGPGRELIMKLIFEKVIEE